jgi:rubrerythrin
MRCLKCGYRWYQDPGPAECPSCKTLYIKWLNYDELDQAGMFREE